MEREEFERVLDSESSIRALSIENAKAFWEAFGLTRGKQLADLSETCRSLSG